MADNVSREFLIEQFRENRRLHERTHDRLDRLERRVGKVEEYVGNLIKDDMEREREFSALENRIARIERRLELSNGGES